MIAKEASKVAQQPGNDSVPGSSGPRQVKSPSVENAAAASGTIREAKTSMPVTSLYAGSDGSADHLESYPYSVYSDTDDPVGKQTDFYSVRASPSLSQTSNNSALAASAESKAANDIFVPRETFLESDDFPLGARAGLHPRPAIDDPRIARSNILPTTLEPSVKYTAADDSFEAHALQASRVLPRAPYSDGPFMMGSSQRQSLDKGDGTTVSSPPSSPPKRKAGEMEMEIPEYSEYSFDSSLSASSQDGGTDSDSTHLSEEIEIGEESDVEPPPSKRIKACHTSHEGGKDIRGSSAGSFTSLATISVLSAAAGSIGTVALLAYLPPDFFGYY